MKETVKPEIILPVEEAELLASFRTDFPEFTVEEYPNAQVLRKLSLAHHYVNKDRFCESIYSYALELVAAHMLCLAKKALTANGEPPQVVASKAVGGVSVSYQGDTTPNTPSWGNFGTTSYGREYKQLVMLHGVGALCI